MPNTIIGLVKVTSGQPSGFKEKLFNISHGATMTILGLKFISGIGPPGDPKSVIVT